MNTAQLINRALSNASEGTDGLSDYQAVALDHMNDFYLQVAVGAPEFSPESQEDWWWLTEFDTFTLPAVKEDIEVTVAQGSLALIFSAPVAQDLTGWHIEIGDDVTPYIIESHSPGASAATLSTEFVQESTTQAKCKILLRDFDLTSDVLRFLGPIQGYGTLSRESNRGNTGFEVFKVSLNQLHREDYFDYRDPTGVPQYFAYLDSTRIRFQRYDLSA